MRLERATLYGVLALAHLAKTGPAGGQQAHRICEETGIPLVYLRRLTERLARARMVVSTRAPGGGFKLARSPGQLTMLQIVEALEGPVDTASVLGDDLLLGRNDATARHLRRWRQQVARVVRCMLEETTLNDIVG